MVWKQTLCDSSCPKYIHFTTPWHMEVLGPGIESKPQPQIVPQLWPHWILNPLCQVRDWTCISAVTSTWLRQHRILNPLGPQWQLSIVLNFLKCILWSGMCSVLMNCVSLRRMCILLFEWNNLWMFIISSWLMHGIEFNYILTDFLPDGMVHFW